MCALKRLIPILSILILLTIGCSNDPGVVGPTPDDEDQTSLVRGEFDGLATSFEFVSEGGGGEPDRHPGPFIVRGDSIRYDDDLGALLVNLTLVNASDRTYPEPVLLTFVALMPDSVTILNADNGEMGPGAAFEFQFENDDAQWTPGEASLPRTVQFAVAPGVAIGFVVRVEVGLGEGEAAIGGLVWHDLNENGVVDADEEGLADVRLMLHGGMDGHWTTQSGPDGTYRFDHLIAGYYTVTRLPRDDLRSTTPPQVHVILVEENGEVSDFLAANFGCIVLDNQPPPIEVGDCLHAKGEYRPDPDRLLAELLCRCDDEDNDDYAKIDDDCWGRVTGPVTALTANADTLWVMGTMLHVNDDTAWDPDEIEIGDRVRVHVSVVGNDDAHHLLACRVHPFNGNYDRVRGYVQEVVAPSDSTHAKIRILDTWIDLSESDGCDED